MQELAILKDAIGVLEELKNNLFAYPMRCLNPLREQEQKTVTPRFFKVGDHVLVHGDSSDPLTVSQALNGQKADLLLTDPPYNVNIQLKNGHIENDALCAKCFDRIIGQALRNGLQNSNAAYIFHGTLTQNATIKIFYDEGFVNTTQLVFVKNHFSIGWGDYHFKHEMALYGFRKRNERCWNGGRNKTTVLQFKPVLGNARVHPTQKSSDMLEPLIENSSPIGGIVLDLFAGSFSTVVAAHKLGRVGVGIELDAKHFYNGLDLLGEVTNQKAVEINAVQLEFGIQDAHIA